MKTDIFTDHDETCTCRECAVKYGLLGGLLTLILLLCFFGTGCAVRKPVAYVPAPGVAYEIVPGHPCLHYGPPHLECSLGNDCQMVRDWLTADGKQVLSPGGCWIAKYLFFTRPLGDKPSMCEKP